MKSLVGGDCYRTILKPIFHIKSWLFSLLYVGAMAIAPYVKTLSGHLFFLPIFINGALKTAPYGGFINQEYAKYIIKNLSKEIKPLYGSGYSVRQLELMRRFYRTFPIANTLCSQLNWSQYESLSDLIFKSSVGRGVLSPTKIQIINKLYNLILGIYAYIYFLMLFLYAYRGRGEDTPTYGLFKYILRRL